MRWTTVVAVVGGLVIAGAYWLIAEWFGQHFRRFPVGAPLAVLALAAGAVYAVGSTVWWLVGRRPWSAARRKGLDLLAAGRFEGAEAALSVAVAQARGHNAWPALIAELAEARADCLRALGRGDAELNACRMALALRQQAFGAAHRETGPGYRRLAEVLRRLGNTDEAATQESFARQIEFKTGRA